MDREEGLRLLKQYVQNANLIKHMLAVEAVMGRLANYFGENEQEWRLAGLLHDIDYEQTKNDPERHSLISGEILAEHGLSGEVVEAVKAHNERHGLPRTSRMAKALYSSDPLTGLIVAAALISPEKKLAGIDTDFVMKRFGEKAFARGANRETIKACSELGLSLEEFVSLGLEAMKGIAGELGL